MCLTPFIVKQKSMGSWDEIPVPCGKCPQCRARLISQWSFRLMQEFKRSSTAHFITLTYDTAHVPLTKNGYMSLDKRSIQLFFKRLRKLSDNKLKYYVCGEYGGRTLRPHYHAIIFNLPSLGILEKAWNQGAIHYGNKVDEAAVGYTLKYMDKDRRIPMHRNDDRVPEFSLMSKKSAPTI